MAINKQISLKMDTETYEKIKKKKEKTNMSLNAFIIQSVLTQNSMQIHYDYDTIRFHLTQIMEIKDRLYPVVAMLTATGQALPKDIQTIVSSLEILVESEKKLLDDCQKERNRLRKQIEKEMKARHDL